MSQVKIIVPATTANLGAGFDCIGAALSLYNEFKFTSSEEDKELSSEKTSNIHTPHPSSQAEASLTANKSKFKITVTGEEAEKVSTEKNNLLYQSFAKLYQHIDRAIPSVEIEIKLGVPLARGLGSSATAIVGGLLGANHLAGNPLTQAEIQELAIALEGHPDNVVPALLGNCQLSVGEMNNCQICSIPWHEEIVPVVAIPNFELSTEEARSVLPTEIVRSDAIFNIARMGLLIRGLETNNSNWLATSLEDKLHQPYRQNLIRGYQEVKTAAIAQGAYGMVISGAGPTLLALTNPARVENVVTAMKSAWANLGVSADVRSLKIDTQGARIKVYNGYEASHTC